MHKIKLIEGDEVGNALRKNVRRLYAHLPAGPGIPGVMSDKALYNLLRGESDPKLGTLVAIARDRNVPFISLFKGSAE